MHGDGDGWVICALGHRHWGRFGAAGLLISDGRRAILQHRAPWTHEGDTWGLPGGARDSHEDPTSTALREASEEAAIDPAAVRPVALWRDDHGGWSYTTVLARPLGPIEPHAANAESTEVRWWNLAEIDGLPLHHGLAGTWPTLRRAPRPLSLIVEIGSNAQLTALRPRGHAQLDQLIRQGVPVSALPGAFANSGVAALLPRVTLLSGQQANHDGGDHPVSSDWWARAVTAATIAANSGGALEAVTADAVSHDVIVVSETDGLARQVTNLGVSAATVTPDWLAALLNRTAPG